jgi:dipeptidyl aminopeptidase/acylaminoacyl peptidase
VEFCRPERLSFRRELCRVPRVVSIPPQGDLLDDLVALPAIGWARVSNHRDQIAFFWNPDRRAELFVQPLEGGAARQVSHGNLQKSPNASFVWSPDDTRVVLPRDTEGNELHDLFFVDLGSGETSPLTSDPTCQRYALEFSPDGQWVLFASDKGAPGEAPQMDLWRIPVTGGATAERLTHHRQPMRPWYNRNPSAPDGTRLAYAASDLEDSRDLAVFVARADGGDPERVLSVRDGSREEPVGWSADGRWIAVQSDAFEYIRAGLLDTRSWTVRWLGDGGSDNYPVEFSPDARSLLVLRSRGVRTEPVVIDLATGAETPVPMPVSVYGEAAFLPDGSGVVAIRYPPEYPSDIATWHPSGGIRVLVAARLDRVDRAKLGPSSVVRYLTFDGRWIEALYYPPRNPVDGVRYPAIIEAHGGPTGQFVDEFHSLAQYLAHEGFAVLMPNVRGSTGYGSKFRDLNLRDLGGGDLQDIVAGVEYLRSLPHVDPERIGIEGISYGGFMTYIALTKHPELFRAGCAIAGVTDWPLGYDQELPALKQYDRELMGDPKENSALWADRSPVNFADRLRAPLLMIHGLHDPRCPVDQARVFRDALLRLGRVPGKDFEYLEFPDVGHWSTDVDETLRTARPMVEFFRHHLGQSDEPVPSDPAPPGRPRAT